MKRIKGKICYSKEDLRSIFREKNKPYIEKSVDPNLAEAYKRNGWGIKRVYKTRVRLKKDKPRDELFEDRIWKIFYRLGFPTLNADRNFKLVLGEYTKQIDVLAKDENNVFIIECKSSGKDDPISVRKDLEYYIGKQKEIKDALNSEWGDDCGRINYVIVVGSENKRQKDENYAEDNKGSNIFLWSEKEVVYIEEMIKRIGPAAKFQLYSIIFGYKKQKDLQKKIPALRGKISEKVCYSFLISGKEFLNYVYIHHRKLSDIKKSSQAYQRMLNSSKLRQISNYIDKKDGFFPNSIIVNFDKSLQWETKIPCGEIEVGLITLPAYYGSAWIIDGQHRLYGIAKAENDITIPVLAFENMLQRDQASMFVDINEKQKKVPSDLLWDLYSDIYRDSEDEKQIKLFNIVETAKLLNRKGPLKNFIDIPSIPIERKIKLSLTNVCVVLKNMPAWDNIKHQKDINKTPEKASELINTYFGELKEIWPEDWKKGNDGVLLTNNGFSVFMLIFNDIIKHFIYRQCGYLLKKRNEKKFKIKIKEYLNPIINHLRNNKKEQEEITSLAGRGPQSIMAGILDLKINEIIPNFSPPRIQKEIKEIMPSPGKLDFTEKIGEAELVFRNFVLKKLKEFYGGDKWWKQGLTGDAKNKAEQKWEQEVKRKPYLKNTNLQLKRDSMFHFLGLGELKNIVIYKNNWAEIFEPFFFDKNQFEERIKQIMAIRNPTMHKRTFDDQDIIDGRAGLLWLASCIDEPSIKPDEI